MAERLRGGRFHTRLNAFNSEHLPLETSHESLVLRTAWRLTKVLDGWLLLRTHGLLYFMSQALSCSWA